MSFYQLNSIRSNVVRVLLLSVCAVGLFFAADFCNDRYEKTAYTYNVCGVVYDKSAYTDECATDGCHYYLAIQPTDTAYNDFTAEVEFHEYAKYYTGDTIVLRKVKNSCYDNGYDDFVPFIYILCFVIFGIVSVVVALCTLYEICCDIVFEIFDL